MTLSVPGIDPDDPAFVYDELAFFQENCAEYDLDAAADVVVERVERRLGDGRVVSALRWGSEPPRVVLVHGGAQNAHTWDTVALALRPHGVLAVDLPGHGRSSWRADQAYDPVSNAEALAEALPPLIEGPALLVGMSLGGLTAIALAARLPEVARSVLVDITPGVDADKAAAVHAFIAGPQSFPTFGEIFERTVEFNPTRTPESLRRGILHNAHRCEDGSWEWNYDRRPLAEHPEGDAAGVVAGLWEAISDSTDPLLLVRGSLSPVVDEADVAELRRRRPDARVVVVDDAGHSVQGDRPIELAALLRDEVAALA